MNIVPKLYGGGDISSLFTTYRPVQTPQVQAPQSVKLSNSDKESLSIKSSSKDEDKEDTKGELTEKDLFNMIKDVDGLPNEMKSIITDLKRTLATESLVGIDTGELANTYLSSLYKLKVANQNKKDLMNLLRMLRRTAALERLQLPQEEIFLHQINPEKLRNLLFNSIKKIQTSIVFLLTPIQLGLESTLLNMHSQRMTMLLRSLTMEWGTRHFRSSLTRLKYHQEVINMRNKESLEKRLFLV